MAPLWSNILDTPGLGKPPYQTLTNAVRVLQHDPVWDASRLWYDEFLDRIFVANSPTREWRDEDDYRLTVYMQETACMPLLRDTLVAKAVRMVAKQRCKHVLRDWLSVLRWDGVERIAHAFEDHWTVTCDLNLPSDYVRAASRNFFIGLVARVFRPGCQLDTMVVFEGFQGLKKTSALRVLASEPWYMAAHESVTKKDFFETLRGKWIVEIDEMDVFSRAEVSRVKAVISTPVDRYRPSYGRAAIDFPRQCIFGGTTNKDDWGNDDTGLRRFWPLPCGLTNLETLAAARDQLLAEAVHLFRAGATWWEMPLSTKDVQADRQAESAWTSIVLQGLRGYDETTVTDVLVTIIKCEVSKITRPAEVAVGRILRLAGWEKKNLRRVGKQGKTWVSPTHGEHSGSSGNVLIT